MSLKSLANVYLWMVTISIYLLPNHPDLTYDYLTKYFNALILLYSIFVIFVCLYAKIKLSSTEFTLSIFLFALSPLTYLTAGYINVHAIFLVSILIFSKCYGLRFLTIQDLKYQFYFALIVTMLGMVFYRFDSFRPTTSWIDPNYSGFYIFLLFSISRLLNLKFISVIIIMMGLLTISRNFVLAVIVYLLLERISHSNMLFNLVKKTGYFCLTIIALTILAGLESTFISVEPIAVQNDVDRFINVVDASNKDRLTANLLFRESFLNSPSSFYFGVDKELYSENIFRNTPHNSFLMSVVIFGLFYTIVMFYALNGLFGSVLSKTNLPLFCGLLVYQNVLGVGHYGLALVFVFFIMNSTRQTMIK